jgi:hypothetical protein
MGAGLNAADYGLKSFEKTRSMQILAWDKWVLLDDVIAGTVQKSLDMFPMAKKGEKFFVIYYSRILGFKFLYV